MLFFAVYAVKMLFIVVYAKMCILIKKYKTWGKK